MAFNPLKYAQLHSTTSNQVLLNSNELTPSNVHSCIWSTQTTFNTLKCARLHSTNSKQVICNSYYLNTLKCVQLHSTTSYHIPFNSNDLQHTQICTIASKMHSNLRNTQINTCNLEMYTCNASISKPPCLQAPTDARNVHQCSSNMTHPKDSSKHQKHLRSAP